MNIEKLKNLREDFSLTMQDLAQKIDVAKSSYSLWEEGIERIPLKRLIDICDFFNIAVDYLIDNTKEKSYSNMKKEYNKELFIKRLKEIRKEKNITQIGRTTIINYEKGYTIPDIDFIIFISKNYNISADYLLGKIDSPKYLK